MATTTAAAARTQGLFCRQVRRRRRSLDVSRTVIIIVHWRLQRRRRRRRPSRRRRRPRQRLRPHPPHPPRTQSSSVCSRASWAHPVPRRRRHRQTSPPLPPSPVPRRRLPAQLRSAARAQVAALAAQERRASRLAAHAADLLEPRAQRPPPWPPQAAAVLAAQITLQLGAPLMQRVVVRMLLVCLLDLIVRVILVLGLRAEPAARRRRRFPSFLRLQIPRQASLYRAQGRFTTASPTQPLRLLLRPRPPLLPPSACRETAWKWMVSRGCCVVNRERRRCTYRVEENLCGSYWRRVCWRTLKTLRLSNQAV
mmetsp:Transcript_17654/g.38307  ORF Transcript_17654/g.38307 Transcript_17654/m.38307 type:complete len:310 (+) Transcript_17654:710-1639(+)